MHDCPVHLESELPCSHFPSRNRCSKIAFQTSRCFRLRAKKRGLAASWRYPSREARSAKLRGGTARRRARCREDRFTGTTRCALAARIARYRLSRRAHDTFIISPSNGSSEHFVLNAVARARVARRLSARLRVTSAAARDLARWARSWRARATIATLGVCGRRHRMSSTQPKRARARKLGASERHTQ